MNETFSSSSDEPNQQKGDSKFGELNKNIQIKDFHSMLDDVI